MLAYLRTKLVNHALANGVRFYTDHDRYLTIEDFSVESLQHPEVMNKMIKDMFRAFDNHSNPWMMHEIRLEVKQKKARDRMVAQYTGQSLALERERLLRLAYGKKADNNPLFVSILEAETMDELKSAEHQLEKLPSV